MATATAEQLAFVALAQANLTTILRKLTEVSAVKVSKLTGMDESTISRMKGGELDKFSALLAACGLQCVSLTARAFEPQYVESLRVLAKMGLEVAPVSQRLDSSNGVGS